MVTCSSNKGKYSNHSPLSLCNTLKLLSKYSSKGMAYVLWFEKSTYRTTSFTYFLLHITELSIYCLIPWCHLNSHPLHCVTSFINVLQDLGCLEIEILKTHKLNSPARKEACANSLKKFANLDNCVFSHIIKTE